MFSILNLVPRKSHILCGVGLALEVLDSAGACAKCGYKDDVLPQ
jgi:hypothetical protein